MQLAMRDATGLFLGVPRRAGLSEVRFEEGARKHDGWGAQGGLQTCMFTPASRSPPPSRFGGRPLDLTLWPDTLKEVKEDERPLRIAMNKLVFWWWCVRNMQPATGEKLVEILKGYGESSGDGTSRVFASSLLADAYRQLDDADSALRTCDEALAGVDGKSHSNGAVPLLLYTKARIQADRGNVTVATDALRRLRALPKDYPQHDALSARVLKLEKQVGVRASSACTEVKVPARKIESVELRVPADVPGEVRWDFMLEDRDIGFSASFRPQDVAEWTELQREARWEATDGPLSGTMRPEGPGTLRLEFDNTFSWVRGKVISYQVDPPLELAVP